MEVHCFFIIPYVVFSIVSPLLCILFLNREFKYNMLMMFSSSIYVNIRLCINVLLDQTLVHNFCSEPKSIIHHYKRSFNGFVAKLTKAEADKMAGVCRH